MRTEELIFTDAGLVLLKKALAQEKKVDFTTMKIGTGSKNTIKEYESLTSLVSFYKDIGLSSLKMTTTGLIKATSYFTNADFVDEVVITEVGLFGKLEGEEEILICYVNDGYGESFPPGNSGNILQKQRSFEFGIDRNTKVTAIVSSTMFATSVDLEAKADKSIKVSVGEGLSGGGDLTKDLNINLLPATKNIIGGVIAGDNIEIDGEGKINAPARYTHPLGNGNNHIPVGGKIKEFLKWSAVGLATWAKILASDIETGAENLFVTQSEKNTWDNKEPKITKNTAFNKDFGTNSLEVLEGAKLAEILGVNYGGILNNSDTKTAGKAYYDTATKAVYLCKVNTNVNYADLTKFEDFSNHGLLNKLENLDNRKTIFTGSHNLKYGEYLFTRDNNFKFIEIGIAASENYLDEINTVRAHMSTSHIPLPTYFSGALYSMAKVDYSAVMTWDLKDSFLVSIVFTNT